MSWSLRTKSLSFETKPLLMAIVNVTPDSFSDGGQFESTDKAVAHAMRLVDDGADILDIGGESTRPYSDPVSEQEELDRVLPVIESLGSQTDIPISIDTSKASVARAAIQAGAEIINDVTGLEGDSEMLSVAVDSGSGICAMHMQGTPQTMQDNPTYGDVCQRYSWLPEAAKKSFVGCGHRAGKNLSGSGHWIRQDSPAQYRIAQTIGRVPVARVPDPDRPFTKGIHREIDWQQGG